MITEEEVLRGNFVKQVIVGDRYEDFIACLLQGKYNFKLDFFTERKDQVRGENKQGIEIKNDNQMTKYGNTYIETEEMSSSGKWVKSGIYKEDNTKHILIGDYETIFMFSKNKLLIAHQQGKFKEKITRIDGVERSKGFVIPMDDAFELADLVIKIREIKRNGGKK